MQTIVRTFKALSDTNRIRILKMLEVKPLCVCEILEAIKLAPSTVSKHLSILHDSEFIIRVKDGKFVNYYLNLDMNNEYVRHLIPMIRSWLPNNETIEKDRKIVATVDRNKLCKR